MAPLPCAPLLVRQLSLSEHARTGIMLPHAARAPFDAIATQAFALRCFVLLWICVLCQAQTAEEAVEPKAEDVIPNTPSLITFSSRGYIKRMPVSTWDVQRRGGKGGPGWWLLSQ